jgi:hypothetical protein
MARRVGDKNQFWNNVAVGSNATSATVRLPHSVGTLALFLTTNGATTIKLQAAHPGDLSSSGNEPDTADTVWHDAYLLGAGQIQHVFAGAGSAVLVVPDAAFVHVRLHNLTAATITAGWLGMPE